MSRSRLPLLVTILVALLLVAHGGPAPGGQRSAAPPIKWDAPFEWVSWEDGLVRAKATDTPICLVIYADWCPKCKHLAPVFRDPEVAKLAGGLVMVLQDSMEKPAWLRERYGGTGTYVPRVLFLEPDGTLREDLTGPNPKFPYFYWPQVAAQLKANMRAVHQKPKPGDG
jgi:thiol:disulfide interchange protein